MTALHEWIGDSYDLGLPVKVRGLNVLSSNYLIKLLADY